MAAFTPASKYAFPFTGFLDDTPYPSVGAGSAVVNVASSAALTTALTNATPGQRIVLASGTYSGAFTLSSKVGSVTNGLSIESATRGGAIFASGSTLTVKDCAHVSISGLVFPYELSAASNTVQFRGSSHHCRITRCMFGPTSVGTPGANKTPFIYGGDSAEFIRVDHNEFRNKANPGNAVLFDGNSTTNQVVKHCRVDHNLWRSIKPEVTNEKEPIRFGVSTMSKSFSYSVIERNVFLDCICEPEVISVKASGVRVSGNTVLRSIGGIVYRHGTAGVIADNHIVDRVDTFGTTIGSGGIRGYDANHEIIFNYVDSVHGGNFQSPLMLDSGDQEGSSTTLNGHWRVVNWLVEGNVLVGNPEGIRFGHNYALAPTGCTVQNNLVAQTPTGTAITQRIAPINTTQTNNLYGSTPPAIGLAQGSDTIWRRPDYGPGTTYLQPADVGVTGDPNDADGTGVLVGSPATPGDPTVAADVLGWGAPLPESDEFGYTGAPNSSKWGVYNGPGHAGNGQRLPARVTVDGTKLVGTGLANGDSFGMAHRLDQQFGRWEVRMRAYPTGTVGQTRGVGGVTAPAGAILATSDQAGTALTLTSSNNGTASNPKVYDGQGKKIGRVTFSGCQYVLVQNYYIQSGNQYGVVFDEASNCTLQNCDVSNLRPSGDGDLNAFTVWGGSSNKIQYNTAVNYVGAGVDPGTSHTDVIQTWVSNSHPNAATNYQIIGNKFVGPANPSRNTSIPSIHQILMIEGANHGGNSGGSGNPSNWLVADNECGDSWNQAVKLDGASGFTFTRNNFVGSSDKVFDLPSASGTTIWSDNQFGSGYGTIGATITPGSGPSTPASGGGNYHPVMIVWPTSERWPQDGEYDFVELDTPGQQSLVAFMHYPQDATASVQQIQFTKAGVDTSQFHNYGFEWTPASLKGFVDGVEWFVTSGGASSIRRDIQAMPSGHLTVQLDNFDGTNQIPATMEVEWARVYSLTPTGSPAGPQTVTAVGIASREAFGTAQVTVPLQVPSNSVPTRLAQNLVLGTGTLTWTLVSGTPPPAGAQTMRAIGLPTGAAFGVPSLDVPPGDQVISVPSIPTVSVFGLPLVGGLAGPPPAEGGVLVPALYAVGRDGTTLTPLPSWTKIHLSPVANSAGSLTVEYPAGAPGFALLHDSVSAAPLRALEIRIWLGGSNAAALGGWLVQKSGDDLVPGSSWSFDGHFHEWLLQKAIIAPQAISEANKTGALSFAGATAGLIFTTMMDQAQARGALPLVTRDFTATHDSTGQPWATSISSLKLAPKTTIAQVADKLVSLGMVEYELTPARMWRAYNPDGRGVDRTIGASPLQFTPTTNLRERARRVSSRDAGTAVLVAGAEGFYTFASSPTAQAELGWRAEVGADAGQIDSQVGVDAVAAAFLEGARAGTAEYNSGVEFVPGQPLPLIDYGVGDWAHVLAGIAYERLRIAQIELDFAQGKSPSGTVVQNDLITDRVTALYRRLNAISTGDAVVGTSTPTPGGAGEDVNPPAAPLGLTVASSDAYQSPGDFETYALVEAGWAPVTTNAYADTATAGQAMAASLIVARLQSGQAMAEDWTWSGAPAVVGTYNDGLLEAWKSEPTNPGGSGSTLGPEALAWLEAYPNAHLGGGGITDDIDHYRVQYRYIGAQVVSAQAAQTAAAAAVRVEDSAVATDFEPVPPRDPNALPDGVAWFEPDESPTRNTTLIFGGVLGGRAVGFRVCAVDRTGNQGPWSATVGLVTAIDNKPPPVPSKPQVNTWFRTMDITWDGKGSAGEDMFAAAGDFAGGGRVEIHVYTGIDFTPDRPVGANGKVDLSTSRTYKDKFEATGTYNVTDLEIGVTYYARFVAVDRNGNASGPSETSDGVLPKQLVTIDYGPDTIDRATIRKAAIGSAEIDQLAVNDIHVDNVSVGKLVSGTMVANVVIGGRFVTPVLNNNQIQIDNAGIRLYQNNTVIGRWQVFDASMLMTGQFNTAVAGQRIVMNPGGANPDTLRFYPTFTDVYSSIDAVDFNGGTIAGIRIVGSGTSAVANRGMVLVRDQNASLVHGRTDLSYWGSEIWVEQNFTRNKSATVDLIVDERLTPLSGPRRVAMITYDVNNNPRNPTGLYYGITTAFGGEPMLYANGQDINLVFGGTDGVTSSRLLVRNNANTQFREIAASAFTVSSSQEVKYGIRGLDLDPVQHLRTCDPKHFHRHGDLESDAERLGFIAEEMPEEVRQHINVRVDDEESPHVIETLDYGAITALLWAAAQRIEQRVSALEQPTDEGDA